jgi:hypothetical protein
MSQVIDLYEDSDDDNGECPNTASVPPLPLSLKRRRENEESSNDTRPHSENGTGDKTVTGSAEFVFDLELADEGEVISPHEKRRATGDCAQNLKGSHATEKDVGGEDAQVTDRREFHEGFATTAAASHPMNSDSEQTSRDDGPANKRSRKPSTSKVASIVSGRQGRVSACEDRLGELADYREIHGHCNVPTRCKQNPELGKWVTDQRSQYKSHLKGKTSPMTTFRIKELEALGFEWGVCITAWEDRLDKLADYRKIYGHCNVPHKYSNNSKLSIWVANQRHQYKLHREGKTSPMTLSRIQELESLGFEWGSCHGAAWEDRFSELANYRKIHGHCNVPKE